MLWLRDISLAVQSMQSNVQDSVIWPNWVTTHRATVPPENMYPFTEVLPRPIRRLTPRSRLGKDAACRNFTEVLPRFAAAYNIVVNGKTR